MKTKNKLILILCSSLLLAAGGAQAGERSGDALLGGLIGGGAGAVIGNQLGGRDGAIIGGALGAATGVAITTDGRRRERYVAAPVYAPVYALPRPVAYYRPEYYEYNVVYVQPRGRGFYGHPHGFRHGRDDWDDHHEWRGERRGFGHDGGRRNYRGWD
jgi:hypothetical protein